jgi:transmembrane sensor
MSRSSGWTGGAGGAGDEMARLSSVASATELGEPLDADHAWRVLQARLSGSPSPRTRRRLRFAIPTFALAVAATVVVVAGWTRHVSNPSIEVGDVGRDFESTDGEVALALPDGIKVDLDRRSQVRLESVAPEEIRVALGKGSARFEVEPRHPRRFVVDADDVEVRVVGTRFRVTRIERDTAGDGARVEIAVERGIVEVRGHKGSGEPHRLRAGERFSLPALSEPEEESVEESVASPSGDDEPDIAPARRTRARRVESAPPAAKLGTAGAVSARTLLERAQVAWRADRMNEAAANYEEVLARHPTDARAGLAAFQLGRIQMDHLSDTAAATVSFAQALHLAPHAAFREDALARLAQANDRLGRAADCSRARDAYLHEYPNGIHVPNVSNLCR